MSRILVIALAVAVLGLLGTLVSLGQDPQRTAFAWLAAQRWGTGIAFGATLWLAISLVAPIGWFPALRPPAEAIAWGVVAMFVAWLPVFAAIHLLYPWAGGDGWLSDPAFVARTGAVWVAWLVVRFTVRRAPVGALVVGGLAWSLLAFDAWMSLDTHWRSSIAGMLAFGAGMRNALAAVIVVAAAVDGRLGRAPLPPDVWHALGRLQLTFLMVAAYLALSQLIIVWIGGLPVEMGFYETRWYGWRALTLVLMVLPAIAFLLLLSRDLKRSRDALVAVCVGILCLGALESAWEILPNGAAGLSWIDACAFAAVLGTLAFVASLVLWWFPADPEAERTLAYRSP